MLAGSGAHGRGASCSPAPSRSSEKQLAARLPDGVDVPAVMAELQAIYARRGVNLVRVGDAWAFRTAGDLAFLLTPRRGRSRRSCRAPRSRCWPIIAYHQPVTRAEIEEIRGVETSKGTLDMLLETDWVRCAAAARRRAGRSPTAPPTRFLDHFGLEEIRDLPGIEELKGAGLLVGRMPSDFSVPLPPADPDAAARTRIR